MGSIEGARFLSKLWLVISSRAMAKKNTTVCTRDRSTKDGEAWYRTGVGQGTPASAAVSEATDFPIENAEGQNLHVQWRSADAVPGNTRLIRRVLSPYEDIGAVGAVRHNINEDGAVRVVADDRWVERPGYFGTGEATADSGTADANFPETASWTVRVWFRLADLHSDVLKELLQIDDGTGSSAAEVLVRISSAGLSSKALTVDWYRYAGAGSVSSTGTTRIDDSRWHCAEMTFADNGGGGVVTLYLNGVLEGTTTSTSALVSTSAQRWKIWPERVAIGEMACWDRALTLEELDQTRGDIILATSFGLASGFDVLEGSGSVIADITGNTPGFTGKVEGGWITWNNPLARHVSGPTPAWHQWRKAQVLSHDIGSNMETTSGELQLHPSESAMFWYRATQGTRTNGQLWRIFKTTLPVNEGGMYARLNLTEPFQTLTVGHFRNGQTVVEIASPVVEDGEWHWALIVMDDSNDSLTLYRDGVQVAQATAPAYSANTSCYSRMFYGKTITRIHGPMCFWSRAVSVSEAADVAWGRKPAMPSHDPSIYILYLFDEASDATTIVNHGAAGTGADLTVATGLSWPGEYRISDDPDGDWLPSDVAKLPPVFLELIDPVVACREVLFDVFAPTNTDLRIGHFGVWEVVRPEAMGRPDGGQRNRKGAAFKRSHSGLPIGSDAIGYSTMRFSFGFLSDSEADDLMLYLDLLRDDGVFVLVCDLPADYARARRVLHTVYGLPVGNGSTRDRQLQKSWFTRDVIVEGVPIVR